MIFENESTIVGAFFWLSVWAVFGSVTVQTFLRSRMLGFWLSAVASGLPAALVSMRVAPDDPFGAVLAVCIVASMPVSLVVALAFHALDDLVPRRRHARRAAIYLIVSVLAALMTLLTIQLTAGGPPQFTEWTLRILPMCFAVGVSILAMLWSMHKRFA